MPIRSNYNRFDEWANGLSAFQYALLIGVSSLAITVPLAVAFAVLIGLPVGGVFVSLIGAAIGVTISSYFVKTLKKSNAERV